MSSKQQKRHSKRKLAVFLCKLSTGQTFRQLRKRHEQELLCAQVTNSYISYNVPDDQVRPTRLSVEGRSAMHVLCTAGEAAKLQSTLLDAQLLTREQ
jgi:hypothetical protein